MTMPTMAPVERPPSSSSTTGGGAGVGVGVAVGTAVGVGVGARVGVAVGTAVGVAVGTAVGVAVGTAVGVAVGRGVAVGVAVGRGVAVGVGSGVVALITAKGLNWAVLPVMVLVTGSTTMSVNCTHWPVAASNLAMTRVCRLVPGGKVAGSNLSVTPMGGLNVAPSGCRLKGRPMMLAPGGGGGAWAAGIGVTVMLVSGVP